MAEKEKKAPEVVRILAVYSFVAAAVLFAFGGLALSGFDSFSSPELATQLASVGISKGLILLVGVLLLGLAVFEYFLGRGLNKGQSWSRMALVLFSVLFSVLGLVSLFSGSIASGIFSFLLYGVVTWYMITNKEVVKFFK